MAANQLVEDIFEFPGGSRLLVKILIEFLEDPRQLVNEFDEF